MLRAGQKLGKYRLLTKLSVGTFATVFRAYDTLEGVYVALKIPHPNLMNKESLADFTKEVKLAARLDHPNILGLKTADYIDGQLVIAFPLGEQSLDDRLAKRMSLRTALDLGEQLLRALAFAHENRVIHCDVKPDNLMLFSDNRLRLTDFGISKIAHRTISASGAGTVGYMAPEQAMGRPSARSDVFAAGIVLWQMFSGYLPEWPFEWPPPDYERMKRRVHPDMLAVLRRAMELKPSHRFESGANAGCLPSREAQSDQRGPAAHAVEVEIHDQARLEGDPPAAIPEAIRQAVAGQVSLPPLPGPGRRVDVRLPVVWHAPQDLPRRDGVSGPMHALPPRPEARLALLPVVLRRRLRAAQRTLVHRPPLHGPLPQPQVPA